jgi:plastocyanin
VRSKIPGLLIAPGLCLTLTAAFLAADLARCQQIPVTARVQLVSKGQSKSAADGGDADVVVWLKALDAPARDVEPAAKHQKLIQSHKTFEPHLLVVQVGSVVDFPNRDPFFHNVFSLFEGKRFDLGLYEAGATNSVRFDRVGVSFLFCNIHPEMSAVVVSVDTPYFGVSDASGKVNITNVPDGRYEVHYWSERGLPESLKQSTRTVAITNSDRNLALLQIAENPNFTTVHKNKYGQDYTPPPSTSYPRP